MIGEPDELGPAAQAILGVPDLIGFKALLQREGNRLSISPLESLERNGERTVALLSEDLDVRAHSGPKFRAQLVELYFHLEDLDFVEQLRRRHEKDHLAGESMLRIRIQRDPYRLADTNHHDVHLVKLDQD